METPGHPDPLPSAVLCPKCGYDMGGLAAGVCPECGNMSDLASLDRLSTTQSELLNRTRLWNAIHISMLFAAAGVFGVIRLIDPPWFPDALGPLNPFILVVLSIIFVLIFSVRRGRLRSALMRTILIRRLWTAHLPWMALGIASMAHYLVGPSSTIAAQITVVCAVVVSLPLALSSVRDGMRNAELSLSTKERSDLRSLIVIGWIMSNLSCYGMVHSVDFL